MISALGRPACILVGLAVSAASLSIARDGAAHIDLEQPPPRELGSSREPNSNLKQGPCGQVDDGRTSTVSVFAPGETIEVTWRETVNHRSYYRIAFDRDGDDAFPTFAGNGRGAQGIDPRGLCPVDGQVILAYELEDGSENPHTMRVTLPDVECERCTLQVVQYMFDANNPYYFQCADLALRRPGPGDAGAASEALDASLADAATDIEPSAAPGCSARIAPLDAGRGAPARGEDDAPEQPTTGRNDDGVPVDDGPMAGLPSSEPSNAPTRHESSGCNIDASPLASSAPGWAFAALVAAAAARRSRRTACVPRA